MFLTYIIRSNKTGEYYIGYTNNIDKRLKQHNNGSNISTKSGKPWTLIYHEHFETKEKAWKREHQIKKYKGGKAFKKLTGEVA